MADMLQNAAQWLSGVLSEHAARAVIYRSENQTVSCKAVCGKTDATIADEYGSSIVSSVFDFLINAEVLGLVPQLGDKIELDGHEFEVVALAGEVWRWSDPAMITRRIHTTQTDGAQ